MRLKISQQPRADPAPVGLLLQLSGFASKQMRFGHLSEGGEKMSSCFGMLQLPLSKSIFIIIIIIITIVVIVIIIIILLLLLLLLLTSSS